MAASTTASGARPALMAVPMMPVPIAFVRNRTSPAGAPAVGAGVDHDRQPGPDLRLEPVRQLGAADPAGERDDGAAHADDRLSR